MDRLNLSAENLKDIEKFYLLYKDVFSECIEVLASVSWADHKHIVNTCSNHEEALFFVKQTIEKDWSEKDLIKHLEKGEKR